jgi:2',3'-cyclic-nucleotide 2'-phosphodiesterase (5'-nucleotidase family)
MDRSSWRRSARNKMRPMRPPYLALAVALTILTAAPGCRRPVPPAPPDAHPVAVIAAPARDAAAVAVAPPRPRGTQLTVLFSANLLGEYEAHPLGGLARRMTLAETLRREGDGFLHLDAGDALLPPLQPIGGKDPDPREVERLATLMANGLGRLRLDGAVPGETDLALGLARLKKLGKVGKPGGLPLLAANLLDRSGRPALPPDRLLTSGGVRVGLIGLVAGSPEDTARWKKDGLTVADPGETATREASALRKQGAQLLVGLFHLPAGAAEARRIASAAGIDYVILGHRADQPAPAGTPPVLEGHHHGTLLGRLDVHLTAGGRWEESRLVPVAPTIAADPAMRALVDGYVAESKRRLEKKLPTGTVPAPGSPAGAGGAPAEMWQYASNAACNMCHDKIVDQWKTTSHAAAVDTLAARGRQRDPYCLGCHSTALMRPGGTRNLETALGYFADVGCESCHGPSVNHVRTQKKTETHRKVAEAVCLECHRPDQSPEPFDYTAALGLVLGPNHGRPGHAAATP